MKSCPFLFCLSYPILLASENFLFCSQLVYRSGSFLSPTRKLEHGSPVLLPPHEAHLTRFAIFSEMNCWLKLKLLKEKNASFTFLKCHRNLHFLKKGLNLFWFSILERKGPPQSSFDFYILWPTSLQIVNSLNFKKYSVSKYSRSKCQVQIFVVFLTWQWNSTIFDY